MSLESFAKGCRDFPIPLWYTNRKFEDHCFQSSNWFPSCRALPRESRLKLESQERKQYQKFPQGTHLLLLIARTPATNIQDPGEHRCSRPLCLSDQQLQETPKLAGKSPTGYKEIFSSPPNHYRMSLYMYLIKERALFHILTKVWKIQDRQQD